MNLLFSITIVDYDLDSLDHAIVDILIIPENSILGLQGFGSSKGFDCIGRYRRRKVETSTVIFSGSIISIST